MGVGRLMNKTPQDPIKDYYSANPVTRPARALAGVPNFGDRNGR